MVLLGSTCKFGTTLNYYCKLTTRKWQKCHQNYHLSGILAKTKISGKFANVYCKDYTKFR